MSRREHHRRTDDHWRRRRGSADPEPGNARGAARVDGFEHRRGRNRQGPSVHPHVRWAVPRRWADVHLIGRAALRTDPRHRAAQSLAVRVIPCVVGGHASPGELPLAMMVGVLLISSGTRSGPPSPSVQLSHVTDGRSGGPIWSALQRPPLGANWPIPTRDRRRLRSGGPGPSRYTGCPWPEELRFNSRSSDDDQSSCGNSARHSAAAADRIGGTGVPTEH